MSDDVKLTFVLRYGGSVPAVCTPSQADELIRGWMAARGNEPVSDKNLSVGTLGLRGMDGKSLVSAIDMSSVIGMYTTNYEKESSQDKIAKAVEKMVEDTSSGDKWKE